MFIWYCLLGRISDISRVGMRTENTGRNDLDVANIGNRHTKLHITDESQCKMIIFCTVIHNIQLTRLQCP